MAAVGVTRVAGRGSLGGTMICRVLAREDKETQRHSLLRIEIGSPISNVGFNSETARKTAGLIRGAAQHIRRAGTDCTATRHDGCDRGEESYLPC